MWMYYFNFYKGKIHFIIDGGKKFVYLKSICAENQECYCIRVEM